MSQVFSARCTKMRLQNQSTTSCAAESIAQIPPTPSYAQKAPTPLLSTKQTTIQPGKNKTSLDCHGGARHTKNTNMESRIKRREKYHSNQIGREALLEEPKKSSQGQPCTCIYVQDQRETTSKHHQHQQPSHTITVLYQQKCSSKR